MCYEHFLPCFRKFGFHILLGLVIEVLGWKCLACFNRKVYCHSQKIFCTKRTKKFYLVFWMCLPLFWKLLSLCSNLKAVLAVNQEKEILKKSFYSRRIFARNHEVTQNKTVWKMDSKRLANVMQFKVLFNRFWCRDFLCTTIWFSRSSQSVLNLMWMMTTGSRCSKVHYYDVVATFPDVEPWSNRNYQMLYSQDASLPLTRTPKKGPGSCVMSTYLSTKIRSIT